VRSFLEEEVVRKQEKNSGGRGREVSVAGTNGSFSGGDLSLSKKKKGGMGGEKKKNCAKQIQNSLVQAGP